MKALIFIVFLVILQQVEGNLIYPKLVGTSIGLPGVWVLAAITVGGGMLGIVGMLLSSAHRGHPVPAAPERHETAGEEGQGETESVTLYHPAGSFRRVVLCGLDFWAGWGTIAPMKL